MEQNVAHRRADAAEAAAIFEALVGPWVHEMYRAAAAIVGERDARDVTQDALVDVWRGFSTLRDRQRPRPWLHAILANRCRKHLRSRHSRPRLSGVSVPMGDPTDRCSTVITLRKLDDLMLDAHFPAVGQPCVFGQASAPKLAY